MKCRKWYEEPLIADECQREDSGCYHCRGSHRTGSQICTHYRHEEEIEAIQERERVNRTQERLILQSRTPNDKMNYAAALKKSQLRKTHFKIRSSSSGQFSRKIKFEYITCYAYLLM